MGIYEEKELLVQTGSVTFFLGAPPGYCVARVVGSRLKATFSKSFGVFISKSRNNKAPQPCNFFQRSVVEEAIN